MSSSSTLEEARKCLNEGAWDEAIERFEVLRSSQPTAPEVHLQLALALAVRGKFAALVQSYLHWSEAALQADELEQAEVAIKEALAISPTSLEARRLRVELAKRRQQDQWIVDWSIDYARLALEQGEGENSLTLLREAAERFPDNLSVRLELAEMCLAQGLIQEGGNRYQEVAASFLALEQPDKALDAYRRLKVIRPEDVELLMTVGQLYIQLGRLDEAEQEFRNVLRHDLVHEDALMALGQVCLLKGRFRSSLLAFRKVLQTAAGHVLALRRSGEVHLKLGAAEEAAEHFLEAARSALESAQKEEATELYQLVLGIDPDNLAAQQALASLGAPLVEKQLVTPEPASVEEVFEPLEPPKVEIETAVEVEPQFEAPRPQKVAPRPGLVKKVRKKEAPASKPQLIRAKLRPGLKAKPAPGSLTRKPVFKREIPEPSPKESLFPELDAKPREPEDLEPLEPTEAVPVPTFGEMFVPTEPSDMPTVGPVGSSPLEATEPDEELFPRVVGSSEDSEETADTLPAEDDIFSGWDEPEDTANSEPVADDDIFAEPEVPEEVANSEPDETEEDIFPGQDEPEEVAESQPAVDEDIFSGWDEPEKVAESESEDVDIFSGWEPDRDELLLEESPTLVEVAFTTEPTLESEALDPPLVEEVVAAEPSLPSEVVDPPLVEEVVATEPAPASEAVDPPLVEEVVAAEPAPEAEVLDPPLVEEVLATETTVDEIVDPPLVAELERSWLDEMERIDEVLSTEAQPLGDILASTLPVVEQSAPEAVTVVEEVEEQDTVGDTMEALRESLRQSPLDLELRLRLADLMLRFGMVEQAVAHYRRALRQEPESLSIHSRVVEAELWNEDYEAAATTLLSSAKIRLARKETEGSLRQLTTLISLDPNQVEARSLLVSVFESQGQTALASFHLNQMAEELAAKGQTEESLRVFERLLELAPTASLRERVAHQFHELGDHEKAHSNYNHAIEIHSAVQNWEEAVQVAERLVGLYPGRLEDVETLQKLYDQLGDRERALEHEFKLAQAFAERGQLAKAIEGCQRLLDSHPDHRQARTLLLELYLDTLQSQLALEQFGELCELLTEPGALHQLSTRLLSSRPDCAPAFLKTLWEKNQAELVADILANVEVVAGVKDGLLVSLKEQSRETDLKSLFDLGTLCFHLGELDSAIEQFQSLRRHPGYQVESYRMLGLCFAQKRGLNMLDLALRQFNKALGLAEPQRSQELRHEVAQLLCDNERTEEALAHLRHCDPDFRNTEAWIEELQLPQRPDAD